jgi:DHA1 family inner membrane transport protein
LTVALFGLTVVFAGLFLAPSRLPVAVVVLVLWAIGSDIFMPSQQRRMVELAPEVRGLVLALNSSAIYVGMALGSFTAGSLVPLVGLKALPLGSVAFLALSLAALWISRRSRGQPQGSAVRAA